MKLSAFALFKQHECRLPSPLDHQEALLKDVHLINHGRVARCARVSALLVSATLISPATASVTVSGGEVHLVDAGTKPVRAWRPAAPRPQALRLQMQVAEGESGIPPVVIRLSAEPNGASWSLKGTELRILFPDGLNAPEAEIQGACRPMFED